MYSIGSDVRPAWQSTALVLRHSAVGPWAAPVLGRFLARPSRRVMMHSAQPLRRSVAIWCSPSTHEARSTCFVALNCLALDDLLRLDPHPRRFAFSFSHLLAYACDICACMSFISACIHAFHWSARSFALIYVWHVCSIVYAVVYPVVPQQICTVLALAFGQDTWGFWRLVLPGFGCSAQHGTFGLSS